MKGKAFSKKRRSGVSSYEQSGILGASAFGVFVGAVCAVALALIGTVICAFSASPDALYAPLGLFACIASYFCAGFAGARKKRAAVPVGALCGAILSVVFFIISLFLDKQLSSGTSLTVALLIRLSLIAVSILGALLGTNIGAKRKRH